MIALSDSRVVTTEMPCAPNIERNRTDSVKHQVFFQQVIRQACSTVGAPMGGVDHHGKTRRRADH